MINSINPISSFAEHALFKMDRLPVMETVVLFVLAIITLFRRELSSNRNYKPKDKLQKYEKNMKNTTNEEHKNPVCNFYQHYKNGNRKLGFPLDGDCLLSTIEYLHRSDLGALSCVSKDVSCRMSQSFLWEQLWMQRYYALWSSEAVLKIRTYRGGTCLWEPPAQINDMKRIQQNQQSLAFYRTPCQGWKRFLLEFDVCWMDWLLAGCSKREFCLIGFEGKIYDITNLIDIHPGSAETLLDNAGGDCTSTFYDVGHSSEAKSLRDSFLIAAPVSPSLLPKSLLEITMSKDSQDVIQCYGYEPLNTDNMITVNLCALPVEHHGSNDSIRMDISDCIKYSNTGSNTSSHACHLGRRRSFYDPITQQWNVWYTCCSQGIPITEDMKKIKPISYSKKLFNSLKLA